MKLAFLIVGFAITAAMIVVLIGISRIRREIGDGAWVTGIGKPTKSIKMFRPKLTNTELSMGYKCTFEDGSYFKGIATSEYFGLGQISNNPQGFHGFTK